MELSTSMVLAIAVYSFGTLGKGFDEVMPYNDNKFLVKTIENVEEKLLFLSFFGE
jgi:ABC-type phosphate/phosphonate transport system permease subunit